MPLQPNEVHPHTKGIGVGVKTEHIMKGDLYGSTAK
jgi:hypothetical protein